MTEFDLKSGREVLPVDQLYELAAWHHGMALNLTFQNAELKASLDGSATGLVTELLRLAHLGLRTQNAARMGFSQPQQLVSDADIQWKQRF